MNNSTMHQLHQIAHIAQFNGRCWQIFLVDHGVYISASNFKHAAKIAVSLHKRGI